MIITFYSYKGGTGRTMALANIAALLATREKRVLAVDFDLEAPGLWRYFSGFHDQLDQQRGLIDLLLAAATPGTSASADWRDYVTQVPVHGSELSLMTSGRLGDEYVSRVLDFDWTAFFQDSSGGEFLERMRRDWRETYDFTLVDSRTGITDSGGICTIMLPDMIVPVFVSNLQSLEGAVDVIERAQAGRNKLAYDRPPAAILPILSRFESRSEYESGQYWLDVSAERVKAFYGDWLPSKYDPRRALERTKLPYVAYFSFGETLPVFTDSVSDPESLGFALNTISQLIEQQLQDVESIIAGTIGETGETTVEQAALAADDAAEDSRATRKIFLSYGDADEETADEIGSWLARNGFMVSDRRDIAGSERSLQETEAAVQRADAFLALLSPGYLASPLCRLEREAAVQVERDMQRAGLPARTVVHVLRVRGAPGEGQSVAGSRDVIDMTSAGGRQAALGLLAKALRSEGGAGQPGPRPIGDPSAFRGRGEEIEVVLRGLTSPDGPHFWLVTAPPQFGKTWFLDRVGADLASVTASGSWAIRRVNLREEPPALRQDARALLARLVARPSSGSGPGELFAIAREIARSGRSHLVMLDSAELLDAEVAAALRSDLSELYGLVETARREVRLALIVASRREGRWREADRQPGMSALTLTEFDADVAEQALRDLARRSGRQFSAPEIRRYAALIHQVSAGVPVLLTRCLSWITDEQWVEISRLSSAAVREQIAGSYIRDVLFAQRSLLPEVQVPADARLRALKESFRVLVPYRFFTESHLRDRGDSDGELSIAMQRLHWPADELWTAINGTSLVRQSADGPWQEIEPAIRRLLYDHYYTSAAQRAAAHAEARDLVAAWADRQSGMGQVIGSMECLWHQALARALLNPAELKQLLTTSAAELSRRLRESPSYSVQELRDYWVRLMTVDQEFSEAVAGVPGLLSSLLDIVQEPSRRQPD
jgi:cellulose biosynthesis protein BcsQ